MSTPGNTRLVEMLTGNKKDLVDRLALYLFSPTQSDWESELERFLEKKVCWAQCPTPSAVTTPESATSV